MKTRQKRESSEQLTKQPELTPEQLADAQKVVEALRAATVRRGSRVRIRLSDDPDDIMERRVIGNDFDKQNWPGEPTLLLDAGIGKAILNKKEGEIGLYPIPGGRELEAEVLLVDNTDNKF